MLTADSGRTVSGKAEFKSALRDSRCERSITCALRLLIEPAEPLDNQDLVLWYVPQMKNAGQPGREYCWADTRIKDGVKDIQVWPCWSEPMFVPVIDD